MAGDLLQHCRLLPPEIELLVRGEIARSFRKRRRKHDDAAGGDPEESAWSVAELGMMQCREGAAPVAVRLIDEWLKRAPENPLLLAASGQAHMAANEDVAAITALEHAVSIVPQHAPDASEHLDQRRHVGVWRVLTSYLVVDAAGTALAAGATELHAGHGAARSRSCPVCGSTSRQFGR